MPPPPSNPQKSAPEYSSRPPPPSRTFDCETAPQNFRVPTLTSAGARPLSFGLQPLATEKFGYFAYYLAEFSPSDTFHLPQGKLHQVLFFENPKYGRIFKTPLYLVLKGSKIFSSPSAPKSTPYTLYLVFEKFYGNFGKRLFKSVFTAFLGHFFFQKTQKFPKTAPSAPFSEFFPAKK